MSYRLFRGKRHDNGAWETGSLVILREGCSDEQTFIADKMTGYLTPVDPKTVGQSIGRNDVNAQSIFEGDELIVKMDRDDNEYQISITDIRTLPEVLWSSSVARIEIIGNIYDKP